MAENSSSGDLDYAMTVEEAADFLGMKPSSVLKKFQCYQATSAGVVWTKNPAGKLVKRLRRWLVLRVQEEQSRSLERLIVKRLKSTRKTFRHRSAS